MTDDTPPDADERLMVGGMGPQPEAEFLAAFMASLRADEGEERWFELMAGMDEEGETI